MLQHNSSKRKKIPYIGKSLSLAVSFALALLNPGFGSEEQSKWQPPGAHSQVEIWPGAAPDAAELAGNETMSLSREAKPISTIGKVSRPTMTVFLAQVKKPGAAVLVFPGGGYEVLAMGHEGSEVCEWLNSKGITAILLKYRVPGEELKPRSGPYPESPMALEDAQRTLGLLRLHAKEWNIDPHKLGVLGFSAGGHLAASLSSNFEKRLYPLIDEADKLSCRPDFCIALYPAYLQPDNARNLELDAGLPVSKENPPTFILHSQDDKVIDAQNSVAYYLALKKHGVPVEMHLYAEGGHGFGIRQSKHAITNWPQLTETWLKSIGMI